MTRRNYTPDANAIISDGATAYVAAGFAQVGGVPVALALDAGGNQGTTIILPSIADSSTITLQPARIDAVAVIYISAMTISGSDIYRLTMVGSNNASVNSNNVVLGQLQFGVGSAMDAPNCANSHAPAGSGKFSAGDLYELPFTNEVQSTPYQYIGMYVSGTFGSITFTSFISVLPRE
jgi:hypothetical protein